MQMQSFFIDVHDVCALFALLSGKMMMSGKLHI